MPDNGIDWGQLGKSLIGQSDEQVLDREKDIYRNPGDKVKRTGIEKIMDSIFRGGSSAGLQSLSEERYVQGLRDEFRRDLAGIDAGVAKTLNLPSVDQLDKNDSIESLTKSVNDATRLQTARRTAEATRDDTGKLQDLARVSDNPEEILKGFAVGSELMCRLALVSPMAIHKQGFHPTAILGAFGASIGISKILKNNISQMTSSLGIVGSMASGIIEYLAEGTWTKRLHPGWAGASGWKSAHFGKSNFKGPRTVFDGKNGIFNSFTDRKIIPDFEKLTNDLGSCWHTNNLAIKPFACGTMTQPFIDCAIKARDKIKDLNEIKSIICKVGEGTVHRLWEPLSEKRNPTTPYSAKFSVPFCIASGLFFGKAGLSEFTEKQIKDHDILNLCSKISYEIDPENEYPKNYSGDIKITLNNSQVIQEIQPGLRGGRLFPLDKKEVEEKFLDNLKFGNLNSSEINNVKKFFETFFKDPDFSLLY